MSVSSKDHGTLPGMDFAPPGSRQPLRISVPSKAALVADLERCMVEKQGFTVATLNLDHIVKFRSSPSFLEAYKNHTHVVADGNPVVWVSRLAGEDVHLAPGSELMDPVIEIAVRHEIPIGLFGSSSEALNSAAGVLRERYPGINVAGCISPSSNFDPEGEEADRLIAEMDGPGPRIWFLALGAPKQEQFAVRASKRHPDLGFLSIGAGVDFIAGTQTRAPAWVRALAAEWIWRTGTDPIRLAPRYARCFGVLPSLVQTAIGIRFAKSKSE